jgi:DNA-binding MarR family transcriptional regulator
MKIEDIIKSSVPIPLSKKTILNLAYTQNCLAERVVAILKPFELSTEQFNVLRILRGQKGKLANMNLIQERMIARTSNTTRLVDKLLAKELVTRNICPGNRRKMEIGITEKGLTLLDEIDPVLEKHEESLTKNLTIEELEQLNTLLNKFRI